MTYRALFPLLSTLILAAVCSGSSSESIDLAVTIYNNQFAMVKDSRSFSFPAGRSDIYFTDVSSNIQPETVTFKSKTDPQSITVYQQNYEANLVNTNSILKQYLNKNVEVSAKFGQKSKRINGTLLGYNSGYILKTSYGIEVVNNIDGISFDHLPQGFFTLPTLHWKVNSLKAIQTQVEVAYRTTGFSWKADYSVTVNQKQDRADLGGWVSIDNNSGKKYTNARLKLIAGDVHTANPHPLYLMDRSYAVPTSVKSSPSFAQKSFSDYHLYTLSEPVTLNDNSQKQVEFLPKVYGVKIRKYNLIEISAGGASQRHIKATNKIEIVNSKENQLGVPLPKGTVRVFKNDESDNSLQFIGEQTIDHTPKDENITIVTGSSFDISADKLASHYRSFEKSGYRADLNLTITNHKDISSQIVVQIHNYRGDNVNFSWKTPGLDIEKVSADKMRLKKIFLPNQKMSYLWTEDYRP